MKAYLLKRLPEPLKQEWRALAFFGLILIVMAGLFFEVMEEVFWEGDPFLAIDTATFRGLQSLRTPALDAVMVAITELGDTWVVVAVAAAVAVWLIHQRLWRVLTFWLIAIGGGSLINSAIKLAMQRARPGDLNYDGVSVFSFPSGHSTTNAVLYGFLLIILAREVPFKWRIPIVVVCVGLVGAVAISRLYLGAHWFSDVAGGLAFGSAWLALLALFYMWRPAGKLDPVRLLLVAGGALIIAGGLNIAFNHATDMARYAAVPEPTS
ncbi:PAP2 superfamily protein [Asticcacaulis biprosthecium C19]|uniref:PAP2 superfamily protein n=1 Tax=Asticcacaulis biprosthecium C19 TaxID=715226 RepID=F4QK21_9CAUL|nr:phosphatase PAP2 family protein [Asticcacaulis biprosthecium]EGF92048.1 PAP2 superfamily protein [Asticcacaulis biprosthecium C19]